MSLIFVNLHFLFVLRTLLIISLLSGVSACANMGFKDLLSDYAQQMQNVRAAQYQGDFKTAASMITEVKATQNNYTLSLLEKARLNYLAQDWQQSRKEFASVAEVLDAEAEKAKLRISRGVANITSLVSSDNALAYDMPAYEQSMLHTYQALNYLFLGQLEGALVEVRRANLVQENALKQHQQELDKGEVSVDKTNLKQTYPSMSAMIGNIKNGFQNAYTFYLSGILYEAAAQPNDAYIDYKRALEIYPDNHYLQQDVLRLASQLNMVDELDQFSKLYGTYAEDSRSNNGEVVIIIEQGVINAKQEIGLNLPIFSGRNQPRFFSFALPVYQGTLKQYAPLTVNVAEQQYSSEQITRLQSLASKQLQDQVPALVTRQALRLIAKEQLRSTMSKEGGDIGNILATIYNMASEHADTRSWLTLPDEVQILRLPLPEGKQQLKLHYGGKIDNIEVDIKARHITLINLTTIGQYQGLNVTQL
jgi:uncharacterized protein